MSLEQPAPRVSVLNVSHRYGAVTALSNVSLDIHRGEFVTLLGPSGCGKTTLLRVIAGFEAPAEGRVLLGGRDITNVQPHRRPVNMVFQRPTLFPHLDVFENVAFGLRIAGIGRAEVAPRVQKALALVRLEEFSHRRSHELSGGQMQRVALARALINRPEVLLLDEPLSALDLKIRLEMEAELRRVHRETGATFVYVTHDQREALSLSDRVAVFNEGRLEQIGAPDEIYYAPTTPFAARFVGDANVIPVEITETTDGQSLVALAGTNLRVPQALGLESGPAWLVVRPEIVRLNRQEQEPGLRASVQDVAFRGSGFSYRLAVPGLADPLKAELPANGSAGPLPVGHEVSVHWDATGCRILPRNQAVEPIAQASHEEDT
ncbi:MAG: ABC transporter ATP-binding protein [Actinobacteria bacterium]|nr:ABC transporter ATP-binding protein [Actinomycetota bacterium]